jgi:hypothetical protein
MSCVVPNISFTHISGNLDDIKGGTHGHPSTKVKDVCDHFWKIYGTVAQEEAKNNKDRLTAA